MNGIKEKFESFLSRPDAGKTLLRSGRTEICGNHTDHQHGKVLADGRTAEQGRGASNNSVIRGVSPRL